MLIMMYSAASRIARSLHLDHIAARDRVDQIRADARVGKDALDNDDAADEVLKVLSDDLNARRQRVAKRIAPENAAFGYAVQAPELDEVLLEHFDHPRPHLSHARSDGDREQREHRQDQRVDVRERRLARAQQGNRG